MITFNQSLNQQKEQEYNISMVKNFFLSILNSSSKSQTKEGRVLYWNSETKKVKIWKENRRKINRDESLRKIRISNLDIEKKRQVGGLSTLGGSFDTPESIELRKCINEWLRRQYKEEEFLELVEAINSDNKMRQHYGAIGLRKILSQGTLLFFVKFIERKWCPYSACNWYESCSTSDWIYWKKWRSSFTSIILGRKLLNWKVRSSLDTYKYCFWKYRTNSSCDWKWRNCSIYKIIEFIKARNSWASM